MNMEISTDSRSALYAYYINLIHSIPTFTPQSIYLTNIIDNIFIISVDSSEYENVEYLQPFIEGINRRKSEHYDNISIVFEDLTSIDINDRYLLKNLFEMPSELKLKYPNCYDCLEMYDDDYMRTYCKYENSFFLYYDKSKGIKDKIENTDEFVLEFDSLHYCPCCGETIKTECMRMVPENVEECQMCGDWWEGLSDDDYCGPCQIIWDEDDLERCRD